MTSQGRRALGRGLEALLPQVGETASGQIVLVSAARIDPNPFQPRRDWDQEELQALADSIRAQGLLQPLVLRKHSGRFQVIAGERRLRAAALAGMTEVPAVIRDADDTQMLVLALVENIQRKDLGPMEKAENFSRLSGMFGLTQEEVGRQIGLKRSTIANFVRLLELPESVKNLLGSGELSMGHGRALLGLRTRASIERTAELAVRRRYSVRQLEEYIRKQSSSSGRRKPAPGRSPEARSLEEAVQRRLGTRVRIVERRGRGRIEVEFASLDELERILDILGVRT
ncbi:ParB/RepB/Spo0J family partition protein [Candidatus Fermentibacteria bacterium]|nr:ParB/RepB/Spo0J family partition protein [Candidatus Fermentibacteria bacterium]